MIVASCSYTRHYRSDFLDYIAGTSAINGLPQGVVMVVAGCGGCRSVIAIFFDRCTSTLNPKLLNPKA